MFLNMNINLKTKDIMSTNLLKVEPNKLLAEVLKELVINKKHEVFIVTSDNNGTEDIKGVLTLNDFGKVMENDILLNEPVSKFMVSPVYIFSPEESAEAARNFMKKTGIGSLPIWNGQKIIGVVDSTTLRDTFYKQTEELGVQLKEIINQIHEGICVVDSQGLVRLWNKSAEKIYRVSEEEVIGKELNKYFPMALLDIVLKSKEPIENVSHSPRENTFVAISAKPIFYNGHLVGAVSSERDITEITQLSMKLDEANERVKFLEMECKRISEDNFQIGSIVGKSKKLVEAIILAKQVSKSNVNVLITGESGTGKEVFARLIHNDSGRKGDFIAINCSAIPSNLLESELFGYVAGAFTGALSKGKKGKFELADKGTLFLDEIGDMPLEMQVKLLRVLQDGEVHMVGGEKTIKTDVRIIAATNKNLEEMMSKGLFREDFYYRLNVISMHLPPLRERKVDIPILVELFLNEFSKIHNKLGITISPEILKVLIDYEWKGNIRELKNTIERIVVLSNGKTVKIEMLPKEILKSILEKSNEDNPKELVKEIIEKKNWDIPKEFDLEKQLENAEKNMLIKVMDITKGNKKKAAEILNIPRSTLYYKLKQNQLY